ncbi:MAG: nucleotidyltransferase domain-containing protein [Thermoflexales bacterium]|nr:nucleotidyltransferase domain-containing protein [Thermoflexales bacterium]
MRGEKGHLSDEQVERVVRCLEGFPNVLAAFLFGSQVDGYATPESDIDLAVLFEREPSLQEELDLGVALCEALGTEKVDLVNLNRAHLLLRHRAISGHLLYERDPVRVSDFIEETILRYIDYEPDLRAFYRDYDQTLEEAYGIRRPARPGADSAH